MGAVDGKRIVVTGAGRGLGRAYAMALAREGAKLVVNDIDADEAHKVAQEIRTARGVAVANGDSVADWNGARRMVEQCIAEFGDIDVLVNNAGIIYHEPIWETTEEQFDRTLEVNLKGTFNTAKHALQRMIPRRSGCIINVSSGSQAGIIAQSVYGATKAGVAAFTYAWAMELAQFNIRVNAISPMAQTRMAEATRQKGYSSPTAPKWPPENVAPLAVFLASDDARYVTGQVVRLEGEVLSLLSHPKITSPVVRPGGWGVEDLRKYFKVTIGQRLEPVGIRAARYEYYEGLEKKG